MADEGKALTYEAPRKDNLVKIYSILDTEEKAVRSYPYPSTVSALKASVRSQSASERLNSDILADNLSILVYINYRKGIKAGMYLEYQGDTYQIKSCDPNIYRRKREWKIVAVSVAPVEYDSEEYTE